MRRDWMTGNLDQLTDVEASERAGHNWTTRDAIERAVTAVRWDDVPDGGGLTWPMSPALAIQAAISDLRLPNVTRIGRATLDAWDNVEAPGRTLAYELLAVEARYSNVGTARVYLVDRGTDVLPALVDLPDVDAETVPA